MTETVKQLDPAVMEATKKLIACMSPAQIGQLMVACMNEIVARSEKKKRK